MFTAHRCRGRGQHSGCCVQVCIRLELLARLGSLASDIYLRGSLVILGYANYPLDVWKLLAWVWIWGSVEARTLTRIMTQSADNLLHASVSSKYSMGARWRKIWGITLFGCKHIMLAQTWQLPNKGRPCFALTKWGFILAWLDLLKQMLSLHSATRLLSGGHSVKCTRGFPGDWWIIGGPSLLLVSTRTISSDCCSAHQ